MLYWILALIITILAYKNSNEIKNKPTEITPANNTKRSITGVVVLIGLYLLIVLILFNTGDYTSRKWVKDNFFLTPQL